MIESRDVAARASCAVEPPDLALHYTSQRFHTSSLTFGSRVRGASAKSAVIHTVDVWLTRSPAARFFYHITRFLNQVSEKREQRDDCARFGRIVGIFALAQRCTMLLLLRAGCLTEIIALATDAADADEPPILFM